MGNDDFTLEQRNMEELDEAQSSKKAETDNDVKEQLKNINAFL